MAGPGLGFGYPDPDGHTWKLYTHYHPLLEMVVV